MLRSYPPKTLFTAGHVSASPKTPSDPVQSPFLSSLQKLISGSKAPASLNILCAAMRNFIVSTRRGLTPSCELLSDSMPEPEGIQ